MAQKKPAVKKSGTKKPTEKRARNKDGTYKGDDKSTPDVNEAYEQPKPGTKATTKPRNPAAKQREAAAPKKAPAKKKPADKKHTYAPKVKATSPTRPKAKTPPPKAKTPPPPTPVADMLTKDIKPADTLPPTLSRYTPPAKKKGPMGKFLGWLFGE